MALRGRKNPELWKILGKLERVLVLEKMGNSAEAVNGSWLGRTALMGRE